MTLAPTTARVTLTCGPAKFTLLSTSPEEYPIVARRRGVDLRVSSTPRSSGRADRPHAVRRFERRDPLQPERRLHRERRRQEDPLRRHRRSPHLAHDRALGTNDGSASSARASSCRARASPRSASSATRPTGARDLASGRRLPHGPPPRSAADHAADRRRVPELPTDLPEEPPRARADRARAAAPRGAAHRADGPRSARADSGSSSADGQLDLSASNPDLGRGARAACPSSIRASASRSRSTRAICSTCSGP